MAVMLIFCIVLTVYAILIGVCHYHFVRIPRFTASRKSSVFVSVIVAARNEEENIGRCIEALLQQDHPKEKTEIIIVDDQSTDRTADIVATFSSDGVRLIRIAKEDRIYGKKAAISRGVGMSTGELIMVTDADCVMGEQWISTTAAFYEDKESVFIASPVQFSKPKKFLDLFQSLDFISLQGITAAGVHAGMLNMCNGANLAYTKSAFEAVGGFEGIDHLPTGDDMLLMEKMSAAFPGNVHYCFSEEVIVHTAPAKDIREFIHQRIRWASKSTVYTSVVMKATLLLVYLINVSFVIVLIWAFIQPPYIVAFLMMWMIKTAIEIRFMWRVARFYKSGRLIWWFPLMQPIHALYTVVAGSFGWVGKYNWKGRRNSGGVE